MIESGRKADLRSNSIRRKKRRFSGLSVWPKNCDISLIPTVTASGRKALVVDLELDPTLRDLLFGKPQGFEEIPFILRSKLERLFAMVTSSVSQGS